MLIALFKLFNQISELFNLKMARDDDDDAHGFGNDDDSCSDEEDNVDRNILHNLPALDNTWSKTELWQGPWLPVYDDRKSGPQNMPKDRKTMTPLGFFLLMFPLYLLKYITLQTNLKALQCGEKVDAFMTLHELCVYLGLHIMMMLSWSGQQDSYFGKGGSFDARKYMCRRRFYWIKRFLHFNDTSGKPKSGSPGYDPLFAVKSIIDVLNATFKKYWRLARHVSLDEMIISFRGRNPFHRFIPRKPHPNGTKLHAICCAVGYFCVSFLVDTAQKMTIPSIAAALFSGVVEPGQTVITDRFYTCKGLIQYCVANKIGFIGSCMTTRWMAKGVFPLWKAKPSKDKERGDFEAATNADGSVVCVAWRDKATVRLMATTSSTVRTTLTRRQKGRQAFHVNAPQLAETYDKYFHGVDRNDQLRGPGYQITLTPSYPYPYF